MHDGLYLLQPPQAFMVSSTSSFDLWHWRLGHPSHERIKSLATDFDFISCSNKCLCHICPLAKQAKLPFPVSSIRTRAPFELIHCDLWGRFSVPSLSGAHYFLTIVDDFSRCTWVYLMRHKSETKFHLQSFFAMVSTQYQSQVKQIRSDQGQEFFHHNLQHFFREHGILHQQSCVQTLQQNGVVERKHRHLLDVARALRFQANLPLTFWGECVLTATKFPLPFFGEKPHMKS